MGLIGDVMGAFGISKSGILAGAMKMVGVPDKLAHGLALAYELKDGFDNANKGAVARHALRAFGITSPTATLAATAALHMLPKGFCGSAIGALGLGAAGVGAMSALGSLNKMQLGIGTMLMGVVGGGAAASLLGGVLGNGTGGGGLNNAVSTGFNFLAGGNSSALRGALGMTRTQGGPGSMYASLPRPAFFEDIIAALMIDHLTDQQEKIEAKAKDLLNRSKEADKASAQAKGMAESGVRAAGGDAAADAAKTGGAESRNIEFEMIKNEIQKLSQMQQALSNVLNTMHEQAMGAIRHIKA
jgi:hypothetical protein